MPTNALRMCEECLTTDSSFPLIPDCQCCKAMLAHDEYVFWNTPFFWEEELDSVGWKTHVGVTPYQFMKKVRQPWRSIFNLFMMT